MSTPGDEATTQLGALCSLLLAAPALGVQLAARALRLDRDSGAASARRRDRACRAIPRTLAPLVLLALFAPGRCLAQGMFAHADGMWRRLAPERHESPSLTRMSQLTTSPPPSSPPASPDAGLASVAAPAVTAHAGRTAAARRP